VKLPGKVASDPKDLDTCLPIYMRSPVSSEISNMHYRPSAPCFDINQGDAAEQNDPWTTFRYFFVAAPFDCSLQREH
jgi:hypothetical protein